MFLENNTLRGDTDHFPITQPTVLCNPVIIKYHYLNHIVTKHRHANKASFELSLIELNPMHLADASIAGIQAHCTELLHYSSVCYTADARGSHAVFESAAAFWQH